MVSSKTVIWQCNKNNAQMASSGLNKSRLWHENLLMSEHRVYFCLHFLKIFWLFAGKMLRISYLHCYFDRTSNIAFWRFFSLVTYSAIARLRKHSFHLPRIYVLSSISQFLPSLQINSDEFTLEGTSIRPVPDCLCSCFHHKALNTDH